MPTLDVSMALEEEEYMFVQPAHHESPGCKAVRHPRPSGVYMPLAFIYIP